MTKISVKCNLDRYSSQDLPQNLTIVPRVDEYVEILPRSQSKFRYPYPIKLQVVSVVHRSDEIVVDVWYDKSTHDHLRAMNFDI